MEGSRHRSHTHTCRVPWRGLCRVGQGGGKGGGKGYPWEITVFYMKA